MLQLLKTNEEMKCVEKELVKLKQSLARNANRSVELQNVHLRLSQSKTKTNKMTCVPSDETDQPVHMSAWASPQSRHSLRCPTEESLTTH